MRGWVISNRARHEGVSFKMIRGMAKQMYATMSDSRDEEVAMSAGWLSRFLHCNNFTCRRCTTIAQKDAREFNEKLAFSSRIFESKELNTCPK